MAAAGSGGLSTGKGIHFVLQCNVLIRFGLRLVLTLVLSRCVSSIRACVPCVSRFVSWLSSDIIMSVPRLEYALSCFRFTSCIMRCECWFEFFAHFIAGSWRLRMLTHTSRMSPQTSSVLAIRFSFCSGARACHFLARRPSMGPRRPPS